MTIHNSTNNYIINSFSNKGVKNSVERVVFSVNCARITGYMDTQKVDLSLFITSHTENYSKQLLYLNIEDKIINLLRGNIRENLYNFELGRDFLDKT